MSNRKSGSEIKCGCLGKAEVRIRHCVKIAEAGIRTYPDGLGLGLSFHDELQAAEKRQNSHGLNNWNFFFDSFRFMVQGS